MGLPTNFSNKVYYLINRISLIDLQKKLGLYQNYVGSTQEDTFEIKLIISRKMTKNIM